MGCESAAIQIKVILCDSSAYVDRLVVLVLKTVALSDHLHYVIIYSYADLLRNALHLGEGEGMEVRKHLATPLKFTCVFKLHFTSSY